MIAPPHTNTVYFRLSAAGRDTGVRGAGGDAGGVVLGGPSSFGPDADGLTAGVVGSVSRYTGAGGSFVGAGELHRPANRQHCGFSVDCSSQLKTGGGADADHGLVRVCEPARQSGYM